MHLMFLFMMLFFSTECEAVVASLKTLSSQSSVVEEYDYNGNLNKTQNSTAMVKNEGSGDMDHGTLITEQEKLALDHFQSMATNIDLENLTEIKGHINAIDELNKSYLTARKLEDLIDEDTVTNKAIIAPVDQQSTSKSDKSFETTIAPLSVVEIAHHEKYVEQNPTKGFLSEESISNEFTTAPIDQQSTPTTDQSMWSRTDKIFTTPSLVLTSLRKREKRPKSNFGNFENSTRKPIRMPTRSQYPLRVHIYFNRFFIYGKRKDIIVTMPSLGTKVFYLNITVSTNDYFIDEKITIPKARSNGWQWTSRLDKILKKNGIREPRLSYNSCYYFRTHATFWSFKPCYVIVMVTDRNIPSIQLAKLAMRSVAVRLPKAYRCHPQLRLPFCEDPTRPVNLDPHMHNNFFIEFGEDCEEQNFSVLNWNFYDINEQHIISHVAITEGLLLKIHPYMVQFSKEAIRRRLMLLRVDTEIDDIILVARCYVRYIPPPVEPVIIGNDEREVSRWHPVVLNATLSHDWSQPSQDDYPLLLIWDCSSPDDPRNHYCRKGMSRKPILRIPAYKLNTDKEYDFILTLFSNVDPYINGSKKQVVHLVEREVFTPQITCKRNCEMDVFAPIDSFHVVAQCDDCPSEMVEFEWWVKLNQGRPDMMSRQRHLVIRRNIELVIVTLTITLKSGATGTAVKILRRNAGPQDGTCTIEPEIGEEATTLFTVECTNFTSTYPPLQYRYMMPVGAIESNVHYERIKLALPETNTVFVSICDTRDMCIEKSLNVQVTQYKELKGLNDLVNFMSQSNIRNMLHHGHWQQSFITLLVAARECKSPREAAYVFQHVARHPIGTVAQLEQLVVLATHLLTQLSPVDFRGAALMANVFVKIAAIFDDVISEREWLHRDGYNTLTGMHIFFMLILGTASEVHPKAMCTADDADCTMGQPLGPGPDAFSDFDHLILLRVNYWLKCTWFLYKNIYYLGVLATQRHHPYDDALTISKSGISYQVNVTEKTPDQGDIIMNTVDAMHQLIISKELLNELTEKLENDVILFQIISQRSEHNIYWWFPEALPAQTNVLILHAYSPQKAYSSGTKFMVENPLVFLTNITDFGENPEFIEWQVNGTIDSVSHVHFYKLHLTKKTMLAVRIMSTTASLRISLRLHRRPRNEEMQSSGCFIPKNTQGKRIWIANFCTMETTAFVAIGSASRRDPKKWLALWRSKRASSPLKSPKEKAINYTVLLETYQCNFWKNRTIDPGWSTDHCTTTFKHSFETAVKCTCHVLGPLSSRIFPATATPYVETIEAVILEINWAMVALYVILLLLLLLVLASYMSGMAAHQKESMLHCNKIVRQDIKMASGADILLVIITGGQEFAFSTSNITLYFKSEGREQVAYHINQDSAHPRLLRNSTCKLTLSADTIKLPTRLAIGIDRNGRYPSWFCRTVTVYDMTNEIEQTFVVNQWIENGTTPFMSSPYMSGSGLKSGKSTQPYTWWQRFRINFEERFINWFLWQPLLGPWLSSNNASAMNRYERSCVWICKMAVTLCIVTIYFGPTTVDTIRDKQGQNSATSLDWVLILYLGIYSYIACVFVHLIFDLVIMRFLLNR